MSEKKLERLLREWQKVLRLQDWRLAVRFKRAAEMPEGAVGATRINFNLKQAQIEIMHPTDFVQVSPMNQDVEATLVHELMHLHFEVLCRDAEDNNELRFFAEQGIEATSLALVELKRRAAA